ncbi:MAG: NADP oxidoreductase [Desulfurivibrio sp.]
MKKLRLATSWLDGCSGCHMSLLDMDELLLELAPRLDLVYSPLVDRKEFPDDVDLALLEGAVSTTDDRRKALLVRARSKLVVALGDCAVTANVPGMRNTLDRDEMLELIYREKADHSPGIPGENIPALLPRSLPLHQVIKVDLFLPGCPPSAKAIVQALTAVLEQRDPGGLPTLKFG